MQAPTNTEALMLLAELELAAAGALLTCRHHTASTHSATHSGGTSLSADPSPSDLFQEGCPETNLNEGVQKDRAAHEHCTQGG